MIAEGRRGDAAEFFMARMVRLPAEFVGFARTQPWWAAQEAIAHTLAYDARVMGDYSVPTATAARVTVPTIILTGGASFPFFRPTAEALVAACPTPAPSSSMARSTTSTRPSSARRSRPSSAPDHPAGRARVSRLLRRPVADLPSTGAPPRPARRPLPERRRLPRRRVSTDIHEPVGSDGTGRALPSDRR